MNPAAEADSAYAKFETNIPAINKIEANPKVLLCFTDLLRLKDAGIRP